MITSANNDASSNNAAVKPTTEQAAGAVGLNDLNSVLQSFLQAQSATNAQFQSFIKAQSANNEELREWRKEQAEREAKREKEQAEREAKRDAELKELRKEQAERDAKREKEQAEREAKRDAELKELRKEQAERDAKREKEQAERDAKRDAEFKELRKEQAERDAKREKEQIERDAELKGMFSMLMPQNRLSPSNAMRSGGVAGGLRGAVSQVSIDANSLNSTPQKNNVRADQFDRKWYSKLSKDHSDFIIEADLPDALGMVSKDWRKEWDRVSKDAALSVSEVAKKILNAYRRKPEIKRLDHCNASEKVYQTAFDHFATAVNRFASTNSKDGIVGMRWLNSHKTQLHNRGVHGRFPDGSFFTAKSTQDTMWQDVIVAVEIKGSSEAAESDVLRGQIIQGLIDMATDRPRRFSFALSLGNKGEIRVYVCTPDKLYVAPLGNLPLGRGSSGNMLKDRRVVAFILFLYEQTAKDCGFLTENPVPLPGEFALDKIIGIEPLIRRRLLHSSISININSDSEVLGRHRILKGPRTWLYPKCVFNGDNAVFKFQWIPEGDLESTVHKFIEDKGIPHIPELLYAATVTDTQSNRGAPCRGEVMIIEDAGSSVADIFGKAEVSSIYGQMRIVDVFAAYVHTLIAAAKLDENNRFVLHRDVSRGNLMVAAGGQPYVIDWGYGRICDSSTCRSSTPKKIIVGTTIYMGIRILHGRTMRSIVDDLESLFLVFCRCLWDTYGDTRSEDYEELWTKNDRRKVKLLRRVWLESKESMLKPMKERMGIPASLKLLAESMYDLLFPKSASISTLANNTDDPRVAEFKASNWLKAFESVAGDYIAAMPYLGMFKEHVIDNDNDNDNRRDSFISAGGVDHLLFVTPKYPRDNTREEYDPLETPTRSTSAKRPFTGQLDSPNSKSRLH
ncbi:hypothetical protein H4217_006102 [Coemansia sp. RSA 1939]|nr:hypothetical protein H4217_006102 [Coemansia sp. RSA 1939]